MMSIPRRAVFLPFAFAAACQSMPSDTGYKTKHDWARAVAAVGLVGMNGERARPGDVFLVTRTPVVDRQAWIAGGNLMPGELLVNLPSRSLSSYAWTMPPYAFAFSVESGLDSGIPTRALAVASGLTGMKGGFGSLTLQAAQAQEIPLLPAWAALNRWVAANKPLLARWAAKNGAPCRVRIITKVVSARQVLLALRASEPFAGARWSSYDNSVGLVLDPVCSPVELDYRLRTLNDSIRNNLLATGDNPALGSVRVVAASSQNLALVENWTHPRAVGYVAWEAEVDADGVLANPQPTMDMLQDQAPSVVFSPAQ